jgi:hypothetical protein
LGTISRGWLTTGLDGVANNGVHQDAVSVALAYTVHLFGDFVSRHADVGLPLPMAPRSLGPRRGLQVLGRLRERAEHASPDELASGTLM